MLGELTRQLNTEQDEIDLVHYRPGAFDTICEQLGRKASPELRSQLRRARRILSTVGTQMKEAVSHQEDRP